MGGWSCLIYIYMVYLIICKCSCVSFSFYPGAFLRLYSRKCFWELRRRMKKKFECGLYDKIPLKFNLIEKLEFFFS